jgi:methylenetetrahydrofolate dehydrogenase (NADP+)/methenyltetrahydrofolate cyclohydrolase
MMQDSSNIVDGRAIAKDILEQARELLGGRFCSMQAITVSPDPATASYLRIKRRAAEAAGIDLTVTQLPAEATVQEVIDAMDPEADAIIVQLPLPEALFLPEILDCIPADKDADALSSQAKEQSLVVAPVAQAVEEILGRGGVAVAEARAVVIGKGRLVGEPVKSRLEQLGATVSAYDEHDFKAQALKGAQILVSGAGVPGLVVPRMLDEGVALIDAGTSEQGGVLVGDIDPSCAARARLYTPVPGGVGPVTVACLMRNAARLKMADIQVH